MPKLLSDVQVARYREEGYLAPFRIMDEVEVEAAALRQRLEALEQRMGGPLRGDLPHKSPPLFPVLAELARHRLLLDAIEDLLGLDIEDSASPVRGIDRFGHFARAPRPDGEMTPATLALHNASAERSARILDRGTGVATFNDPDAIRG